MTENRDNIKMVTVFAGEHWQATMIKNILEDNQIQAFLENEHMGSIAPWRISPGGIDPVKVNVSSTDAELAKKLIDEYNSAQPVDESDSNH